MKKTGFTLIELLGVVAIIVILAGVLLPGIKAIRDKHRVHEQTSPDRVWNGSTNGW